jgi:signal transduction histidine kinase
MNARSKHAYTDWMFGGLMFLLCVGLTVLQYRWTGEIANAELIRMRSSLDDQSRAMARAFDMELSESCSQLFSRGDDFGDQSREAAVLARFKSWKATSPRPIFSRIAVAVPAENELQLSMLDKKDGQFIRATWPDQWSALRDNLTEKLSHPSPPFDDASGALLEMPLFDGAGPHDGPQGFGDVDWLILEIDLAYARDVWLPELVTKYLNPDGRGFNEALVEASPASRSISRRDGHGFDELRADTAGRNSRVLYSSQTNVSRAGAYSVSVRFNQEGRSRNNSRGPTPDGRWVLETWYRPGVLEATVAASRQRNLAVAVLLNMLMFATGIVLVRNTRRSRELAEAQVNFVANVSHELRTPLTVIRGAAHNMKRGVVHERTQIEQYSGLIIQHAEQLTEMIEQLLELAGARKNSGALAHNPVALPAVLKDAIAGAAHDTQAAGCVVELDVPAELPPVSGDASALRRVFVNLIANAAKHGGDGKWIGVTAAVVNVNGENAPAVEVRVADRGAGISEKEQAEIFKPFVRGEIAKARQIRGSGLGLSVVHEIVELHQGSVTVKSKPQHGATFIVRLPVSTDQGK